MKQRICPRCFLQMPEEDVLNSESHDGKLVICSQCGQIESLGGIYGDGAVYGLLLGQRRTQAAMYGLNKNRDPNIPTVKLTSKKQRLYYDTETKQVTVEG